MICRHTLPPVERKSVPDVANAPLLKDSPEHNGWPWWAGALAVAAATTLAFSNTFQGPFMFDDREMIVGNPYVRDLWPPWGALFGPPNMSRPLIGLSLAINYAISGFSVWSYHLMNLVIHTLAALALFGVARRTLMSDRLRGLFGDKAFALALAIAIAWAVHPLQTQSVTYIIQRCESLMGMFYLATLYFAVRAMTSESGKRWQLAAVAACAGGMLSKQVMVTAPLAVLIYDSLFVSGSIKEALRRRAALYSGLAATWGLLVWTTLASPANETAGFGVRTVSPLEYFVSQFAVLVHYLRLSVWPDSLVLDYDWPKAQTAWDVAPYALILTTLGLLTLYALARRKPVGFIGAWFFLILSVTSSFMPFSDLAFEHRMYLPLAAVVALVVLCGYRLGDRLSKRVIPAEQKRLAIAKPVALLSAAVVMAVLTSLTLGRNEDYESELRMWTDVVTKRPQNARGHNNLGLLYAEAGELEPALWHFGESVKYNPLHAPAHNNLGLALASRGNIAQGKAHLLEALRLRPGYADAHFNMQRALIAEGNTDEAFAHFRATVAADPKYSEAYMSMAQAFEKQQRFKEAADVYKEALTLQPRSPEVLMKLALSLAQLKESLPGAMDESIRAAEAAAALTGNRHPVTLDALATVYAAAGRMDEAIEVAEKAAGFAAAAGNQKLAARIEAKLDKFRGNTP